MLLSGFKVRWLLWLQWSTGYCLITVIEIQCNIAVKDSQGSALIEVTQNNGKLTNSKIFREELFTVGRGAWRGRRRERKAPGTDGQMDLPLAPPMQVSHCIPPTSLLSHLGIYVILKPPNCGAGSHNRGLLVWDRDPLDFSNPWGSSSPHVLVVIPWTQYS